MLGRPVLGVDATVSQLRRREKLVRLNDEVLRRCWRRVRTRLGGVVNGNVELLGRVDGSAAGVRVHAEVGAGCLLRGIDDDTSGEGTVVVHGLCLAGDGTVHVNRLLRNCVQCPLRHDPRHPIVGVFAGGGIGVFTGLPLIGEPTVENKYAVGRARGYRKWEATLVGLWGEPGTVDQEDIATVHGCTFGGSSVVKGDGDGWILLNLREDREIIRDARCRCCGRRCR